MYQTRLFYASFAFLVGFLDLGQGFVISKLPPTPSSTKRWTSSAKVSSNEYLLPGIQAIDASNEALFHKLESLREERSFRFYSVDILASCEYMPQELFECYTESCEIYPVDEEEVRNEDITSMIGTVQICVLTEIFPSLFHTGSSQRTKSRSAGACV